MSAVSALSDCGAVFDWDGVIIDSSRHHEESWHRLAREQAYSLPEGFFKTTFGMKNEEIIPRYLGWADDESSIRNLSLRKEELYRDVVREIGIVPLPGVTGWLKQLKEVSMPCVIASSTHRENILLSLELLGIADAFSAIVTSEDVSKGKPHPEVFLMAAEKINRDPGRCVVFEDAHVGVQAGKAAGMKVVALSTTHPAASLSEADMVVKNLSALEMVHMTSLLT